MILTLCVGAHAQQPTKVHRIGYLTLGAKPAARDEAFVQGLRDLGWIDGQNIAIEYRWAANKVENLPALANELVVLKVDLIVALTTPPIQAAKNATKTIPIVMGPNADPVGMGFVASLARPGANITGMSSIMPELAGKRLELLKEVVPKLSRIAFLAYRPDPAHGLFVKQAQEAAQRFKIRFQPLVIAGIEEIEGALSAMTKERAGALIVQPLFISALGQGLRIAELAAVRGVSLPALGAVSPFITALPPGTPVNVNTAPPEVLAAILPDARGDTVAALVARRAERPFNDVADFRPRVPQGATLLSESSLAVRSDYFYVSVEARQGTTVARARALLRRGGPGKALPVVVWQVVE
jgi:putative ABC transport system substrate-binding protein